jgi:agmatinase
MKKRPLILFSIDNGVNPFRSWATMVDCGDIFNTPFDKHLALKQLEKGVSAITAQKAKNHTVGDAVRIVNIGGDHTISKPESLIPKTQWKD